jgi:hypothetical protein
VFAFSITAPYYHSEYEYSKCCERAYMRLMPPRHRRVRGVWGGGAAVGWAGGGHRQGPPRVAPRLRCPGSGPGWASWAGTGSTSRPRLASGLGLTGFTPRRLIMWKTFI